MKLEVVTTVLLLAFVGASSGIRIQPRKFCPSQFVHIGDSCYYFSLDIVNSWDDAWLRCERLNSRSLLVNIESEVEWNTIKNYLKENGGATKNWWIGGSDRDKENTWVWVATGQPFTVKFWCSNEPNNVGASENCAAIQGNTLCWRDLHCTKDALLPNKYYICEYE